MRNITRLKKKINFNSKILPAKFLYFIFFFIWPESLELLSDTAQLVYINSSDF